MPRSLAHLTTPIALALLLQGAGCSQLGYIQGTKIVDSRQNREIIARVEEYRQAMEQKDAAKLLAMAHPNYYEDSGTPSGADDYGYPGLKRVLDTRLSSLRTLRYAMQYRRIAVDNRRATVDIRYDISYQIATELGEKWERRQNDKRLELEFDGNRWLFLSGY